MSKERPMVRVTVTDPTTSITQIIPVTGVGTVPDNDDLPPMHVGETAIRWCVDCEEELPAPICDPKFIQRCGSCGSEQPNP